MDFKFNLKPKPTKLTAQELVMIKSLSIKLPPITDAKMIEASGAKLLKQGFKKFDNGVEIVKGARYKFEILIRIDHYQYMLKLFKRHGLEGIQAYVEFVKQIYIIQLKKLEEQGIKSIDWIEPESIDAKEADQLPGLPPNENNPT